MLKKLLAVTIVAGLWAVAPAVAQDNKDNAVKEGAKKTGEATKEAGKAIGEAGKKVGEAGAEAGKTVGEAGKEVGKATGEGGKEVGKEVAGTSKKTGSAIKNAAVGKKNFDCKDGTSQSGKDAATACAEHGGVKAPAAK